MEYCNWLSRKEGIEPVYKNISLDESCLPSMETLNAIGYRLPTHQELEIACRAGATTLRFYGDSEKYLKNFCWYKENSASRLHPVGGRLPNDFGLFDTLGNAAEWVHFGDRPADSQRANSFSYGNWYGTDSRDLKSLVSGSGINHSNLRDRPIVSMVGFRVVRVLSAV
jgi:formylglycine-generating enzyme required for sulfatase activity